MVMNNAQSLGTATGTILIDVSSLQAAQAQMQQFAANITKAFANAAAASSSSQSQTTATVQQATQAVNQLAKQATAGMSAVTDAAKNAQVAYVNTTTAATAAAQAVVTVHQKTQEAIRDGANATEQSIARMRARAEEAAAVALRLQRQTSGGENVQFGNYNMRDATRSGLITPSNTPTRRNMPTTPTFIQFAAFPFAGLAQQLGAQGLSQGAYGVGNILGIADAINPAINAIQRLGAQLVGMGGIAGRIASVAGLATAGLGATTSALASVLAVALPIVAVIAALALVFGRINGILEDGRKRGEQFANAMQKVAGQLGEGRTEREARTEMRETTVSRDYLATRTFDLQQLKNQLDDLAPLLLGAGGGTTVRNVFNASQVDPLLERVRELLRLPAETSAAETYAALSRVVEENVQQISTYNNELAETTTALEDGVFALQAYADKIFQLNDAATKGANLLSGALPSAQSGQSKFERLLPLQGIVDGLSDSGIRLAESLKEVDKVIKGIVDEVKGTLTIRAGSVGGSGIVTRDLPDAGIVGGASDLGSRAAQALKSISKTFETEFVERLRDGIRDTVDFVRDLIAATADFNRERGRMLEDRATSADRNQFDFMTQRRRRIEDFNAALLEADADYAAERDRAIKDFNAKAAADDKETRDRRQELIDKFNLEEKRRLEDYQVQVARIARDGRISALESASRLDARAVFETQRRTRTQLQDMAEDFARDRARRLEDLNLQLADLVDNQTKQREQRQRDFAQQLADQDAQYALQRARKKDDFDRQLALEAQDRTLNLARQAEDYRIQDLRRQEDFNRRISQLVAHNQTVQNIVNSGAAAIQFSWQYLMNSLTSMTQTTATQTTTVMGAGYGGRVGGDAYDIGTSFVPKTGLALIHKGEAVLKPEVAALYRAALGSNFTQADAARFASGGRSGDSTQIDMSGAQFNFGDIGGYSESQIMSMMERGLQEFFGGVSARRGRAAA
jgi:hypothetical protein